MNDAKQIHDALYYALIEMRAQAEKTGDKLVFHLADLFHGVPGQLTQVARGERTYADVLAGLHERADQKGCRAWLDNVLRHTGGGEER
jgi:hypothetical protein